MSLSRQIIALLAAWLLLANARPPSSSAPNRNATFATASPQQPARTEPHAAISHARNLRTRPGQRRGRATKKAISSAA